MSVQDQVLEAARAARAASRTLAGLDADVRAGALRAMAQALRDHWAEVDWPKLDEYLIRFASGAVYKRLGYLVETLNLPIVERAERLASWQTHLTAGIALLDPGESTGGSACMRWRVCDNISLAPAAGGPR